MKVVITSIELKSPFYFFRLTSNAFKVSNQLKKTACKDFKKKGFWKKHYTMTLWNSEVDMRSFSVSGSHLEAIKISNKIAREIRTMTVEMDHLPDWGEAHKLLKHGKVFSLG